MRDKKPEPPVILEHARVVMEVDPYEDEPQQVTRFRQMSPVVFTRELLALEKAYLAQVTAWEQRQNKMISPSLKKDEGTRKSMEILDRLLEKIGVPQVEQK